MARTRSQSRKEASKEGTNTKSVSSEKEKLVNGVPLNQNEQPWTNSPLFVSFSVISLMLFTPPLAVLLAHTHIHLNGSIVELYKLLMKSGIEGIFGQLRSIYPSFDNTEAWQIITGFAFIEAFLMMVIPGKKFKGPVAPSGHVPIYKANGMQHWFVANILFWATWYFEWYEVTKVYDHFVAILAYLSFVALGLCVLLAFKGIYFPSTPDSGSSGNIFFDFYSGTELYPRVFGLDVKVFTNCRFGMMAWVILPYVYMLKQYSNYGHVSHAMLVSVVLQEIYIAKFFWWETGYFWSIDIMHDRAGYYICWGCLVWLPSVYTCHTLYLVENGPSNSEIGVFAWVILVVGILAIYLNYDADRQRYEFRQKDGEVKVWGKDPVYVQAQYVTEDGKKKKNKLLASGYWGIARHLQYVFELTAALSWCIPALFKEPLPYFYFFFLVILLTHRAIRDDHKCGMKYGKYWTEYKKMVPYNMIPGVF